MKKIIYLNLLLTGITILLLMLTAAIPASFDDETTLLVPDASNCAYYYQGTGVIRQIPCTPSCAPDCPGGHVYLDGDVVRMHCTPGTLFNRQTLSCDPPSMVTCHHSPQCTN